MQSVFFPCEDVSLVIGIGQDLLARWQGLTFGILVILVKVYLLDNKRIPLQCYQVCYQQVIVISELWLDG